jgi:hypothetical protein
MQQLLHSQYSEISMQWVKAIITFIVPGSDFEECKRGCVSCILLAEELTA